MKHYNGKGCVLKLCNCMAGTYFIEQPLSFLLSVFYRTDNPTADFIAGVTGGLCGEVIPFGMDNYGTAQDV